MLSENAADEESDKAAEFKVLHVATHTVHFRRHVTDLIHVMWSKPVMVRGVEHSK